MAATRNAACAAVNICLFFQGIERYNCLLPAAVMLEHTAVGNLQARLQKMKQSASTANFCQQYSWQMQPAGVGHMHIFATAHMLVYA